MVLERVELEFKIYNILNKILDSCCKILDAKLQKVKNPCSTVNVHENKKQAY